MWNVYALGEDTGCNAHAVVSRAASASMLMYSASDNLLSGQVHQAHDQDWKRNLFLGASMDSLHTFSPLRVHDIIAIIPIETGWLILHILSTDSLLHPLRECLSRDLVVVLCGVPS